jgi:hypothetical protein
MWSLFFSFLWALNNWTEVRQSALWCGHPGWTKQTVQSVTNCSSVGQGLWKEPLKFKFCFLNPIRLLSCWKADVNWLQINTISCKERRLLFRITLGSKVFPALFMIRVAQKTDRTQHQFMFPRVWDIWVLYRWMWPLRHPMAFLRAVMFCVLKLLHLLRLQSLAIECRQNVLNWNPLFSRIWTLLLPPPPHTVYLCVPCDSHNKPRLFP